MFYFIHTCLDRTNIYFQGVIKPSLAYCWVHIPTNLIMIQTRIKGAIQDRAPTDSIGVPSRHSIRLWMLLRPHQDPLLSRTLRPRARYSLLRLPYEV